MLKVPLAVLNATAVIPDDEVARAVAAVQTQVRRDFAPVWQIDTDIEFIPAKQKAPSNSWWIVILDYSDLGGALGYHDLTNAGLPMGKVFAATDKANGLTWTVTLSHEILEVLADPNINRTALQITSTGGLLHAYEVGDACEADEFAYSIDGQLVSDFLYPAWFSPISSNAQFDYRNQIRRPFELLPGGFSMVYDLTYMTGWHMLVGDDPRKDYNLRPRVGSRRERRRTDRRRWMPSSTALTH